MRKIALLLLVAGTASLTTGCATPAYSAKEREALIRRNREYEFRQAVDDWDSFWLLRPASRLTIWNVR